MAAKKYYWLKLKSDFFEDDTIQFIEEQENGILYVNFYLKLCLKSLKCEGKLIRLIGNTLMPYDAKTLSKLTNTDVDTVRAAMGIFKRIGLVEILDDGEIYLTQINEMIGSETASAERVRKHRLLNNSKALQCNTDVTPMLQNGNTEKEIRDKSLEFRYKSKEKDKKETYVSILDAYTDNENLKKSLQDYVEMRNKMKGFTTRALKLNLNELDKLADDIETKINIVNQSIKKSWKSFYKLKSEDYTKTKELPSWYHDQSNIKIDTEDFNETEMLELQKQLRGSS